MLTTLLNMQVMQLKTSRDKLLSELDIQFIEAERLGNENSALSQVSHFTKPCEVPNHLESVSASA